MDEENAVDKISREMQDWNQHGVRLQLILAEFRDRLGDAPLYVTEDGKFFVHPDVLVKLHEPGNEGPLEFLKTMQQTYEP